MLTQQCPYYIRVGILKSKAKPCIMDNTYTKIYRHQKIRSPSIHPLNFSSANLPCAQLSISWDLMSLELPRALLVQLCLLHTKVQEYFSDQYRRYAGKLDTSHRTQCHTKMLEAMFCNKCRVVEAEPICYPHVHALPTPPNMWKWLDCPKSNPSRWLAYLTSTNTSLALSTSMTNWIAYIE